MHHKTKNMFISSSVLKSLFATVMVVEKFLECIQFFVVLDMLQHLLKLIIIGDHSRMIPTNLQKRTARCGHLAREPVQKHKVTCRFAKLTCLVTRCYNHKKYELGQLTETWNWGSFCESPNQIISLSSHETWPTTTVVILPIWSQFMAQLLKYLVLLVILPQICSSVLIRANEFSAFPYFLCFWYGYI